MDEKASTARTLRITYCTCSSAGNENGILTKGFEGQPIFHVKGLRFHLQNG